MRKRDGFKGQRSVIIPDFIIEEIRQNSLDKHLYITDIGYYPSASKHYRSRKEGCSQNILLYCVEGKGWIFVGDKEISMEANQYFIIPQKKPHSYASNRKDPWSIYWVHFSGSHAKYFISASNKALSITPSEVSRIDERKQLFEEMLQNLEMGYSIENINYANICLRHFLASFRYLSQFRQVRATKERDMVENSILFMKDQLKSKLTLEILAKHAGISKSHYSFEFRKKTGRSPLDYLIHLKIQYACRLLDHTLLRVNEVAIKVGYDDPYYFSRIFSKIMGISPKEYRHLLKG